MLNTTPNNALYAITDCQHLQGAPLLTAVEQILHGGCRRLQYRDKSTDWARRAYEAQALQTLCQRYSAQLIINDDIELARQCGAQGVHLGQGDSSPREARQRLGTSAIIGVTCHGSLAMAQRAVDAGANYLAFGRFFNSHTKPCAPPAALELLTQARNRWPEQTLVAIGGITHRNAARVIAHGAHWAAVCQDVFHARDKTLYTQQFASLGEPSGCAAHSPSGALNP